jgi:creatinine amidohydrolase
MRSMTVGLVLTAAAVLAPPGQAQRETPAPAGRRLADMPWTDAERLLTAATVVVIPLGAGSKEHGPHLRLRNDETLAEYLTQRVVDRAAVIVAPTLTYHYYPAFLEYPGSTSLSLATARDMTTEVVRSLARYGPRRFYVLNTGMSTVRPLEAAARTLAAEGILMRFTSLDAHLEAASRKVARQEGGSHADEVETSMMLHIDPRHDEGREGLWTPLEPVHADAAGGRDRNLVAERNMGRSDARNSRKGTSARGRARRGCSGRHREPPGGVHADTVSDGATGHRPGAAGPGQAGRPARPVFSGRRTLHQGDWRRLHGLLGQR